MMHGSENRATRDCGLNLGRECQEVKKIVRTCVRALLRFIE